MPMGVMVVLSLEDPPAALLLGDHDAQYAKEHEGTREPPHRLACLLLGVLFTHVLVAIPLVTQQCRSDLAPELEVR